MATRIDPKIYNRRHKKDQYKNCAECGAWKRTDSQGRCDSCASVDRHLMTMARNLLATNPKLSPKEVADALGADEDRVNGWIRDRKIKPQALKKKCPNCGRVLVNRFSCDSCGYGKPPDPKVEAEKKRMVAQKRQEQHTPTRRVKQVIDSYWSNHSEISTKHQNRRLWMVPLGIHGKQK